MRKEVNKNGIVATIDPTNAFQADPLALFDMCGYVPPWFIDWSISSRIKPDETAHLKEHMEDLYGFGALFEMTGGKIDDNYVYQYPEDPELPPFLIMGDENQVQFIQYPHAIVALREKETDDWYVTRMD